MAFMQISIIPLGTSSPSVGEFVADVQSFLRRSGCHYELNDMSTVVSGHPEELFSLAARIHELPFSKGAERVVTNISMDERRDKNRILGDKKKAVLKILADRNDEG